MCPLCQALAILLTTVGAIAGITATIRQWSRALPYRPPRLEER